jgi:uncharacterized protein
MKIPVDRLTSTPAPFAFECDSRWWRSTIPARRDLPRDLAEPFRFAFRAHRMGEDIFIEGRVEGSLELECARCLARYRHAFCEPFRLLLEPAGARSPADPEGAEALARDGVCLGEDLEAGWFRGSEVRLDALSAEVVSLALPVKPLCREDCPGLCPSCGVDLKVETCGCTGTNPGSPFAVLATLREGPATDEAPPQRAEGKRRGAARAARRSRAKS